MTAKEYLQQIYITTKKIERLEQSREQLRADLYSIKSPSGSMSSTVVSSSVSGDKMEKLIAKADCIERDIVKELDRLIKKRDKITRQIEKVPDERYRTILYQRYVQCLKWERIADNLNHDLRYVYRLHGDALQVFDKLFDISH